MTGKAKAALALVLLGAAAGAGMFAGLVIKARQCREVELQLKLAQEQRQAELGRSEIAALEARLTALTELSEKPAAQKAAWREKGSGKEVKAPRDCASCLAQVKREVEVRDEAHDWWVYHDPDVLDDRAGELTLTPRFFQDTAPPEADSTTADTGAALPTGRARKPALAPPEKSLRAGLSLSSYELEFSYAPLVLQSPRASLSLDLRSRLTLGRYNSDLCGDLGAGIEIKW
ncbi:MAG TPA: hypothetical protein VM658_12325 [bacterium]|nr:hypothetical protein [bacterium]